MRILHVNNWHRGFGGSDHACARIIELCRRRGLDVEVFERDSKKLPPGLRGRLRAFAGGIYPRAAVDEFSGVLRSFQPDVVHFHELFPLISPWILPRCTAEGIPVVMTCYDFRITCPVATHHNHRRICHDCVGGREYKAVLNNCRKNLPESAAYALRSAIARRFGLFANHVSRFIVLTEFSRRWIEDSAKIPAERVAIVPCIVPAPPSGVADPAEGAYVAYSGRFAPEKGVHLIIEACRKEGLPLRLAGDKSSHPAIRPDDDAACVPTPTREALVEFYRGARVLAVTSLWEETFATVLSEAKSHGIPAIAPRIGAMPNLVEDGVTGLLFEPGNVDELAKKLRLIWDDAALCRKLGAAGRRDVQENLNEDACFEGLVNVYEHVVGRGSAGQLMAPRGSQERSVNISACFEAGANLKVL
jgi:glycosyltransferase involved in cell wall biosynthesis